jgi:serine/threonine protein kinase
LALLVVEPVSEEKKAKKKRKASKLPESIGKYVITRLIGEGGMGRVYRGIDPDSREVVAVKTILEARLTSASALPRFLREIQILAGLDHPGVVKILDRGLCSEGHFLVMEYLEGKPLDRIIRRGPRFDRRQALHVVRGILTALEYLHGQGIMHRDLKPGNILLADDGRVTLVDFGLSRFLEGGATVTSVGRVIGSPHYLPPEQWRGEKPDHRADIYQTGILAIELVTGKVPFSGSDLRAIMESCLNFGVNEDLLESLGVIGDLSVFIRGCTRRRANLRYQTVTDALADLDHVIAGRPLPPRAEKAAVVMGGEDVDLDAPTDLENPVSGQSSPREAAISVSRPRGKRPKLGKVPRRPNGKSSGRRRSSSRKRSVKRRASKPSGWMQALRSGPNAALAGGLFGIFLAGIMLYVLTRPPPPPPLPHLVMGPLVSDGMATAEVRWETDLPLEGMLEVRGGGDFRTLEDPEGASREHEIFLKNLKPGARYTVQVQSPRGPLGDPVEFIARGVSIAFEPLFTRRGLELHWSSEDPLLLGDGSRKSRSKPAGSPNQTGQLMLPGVRPGAGKVTVLAFSPMGAVLPVAWTVPGVEELAERVGQILTQVASPERVTQAERDLISGEGRQAADRIVGKIRKQSAPFGPPQILTQASLVLDDSRVPLDQRWDIIAAISRLRRMRQLLELRSGGLPLKLELAEGELFRWGAVPGRRPRGAVLASWSPPPAPLIASFGLLDSENRSDSLRWEISSGLRPRQQGVSLLVHCIRLSPALSLELYINGRGPMMLLTTRKVQELETLDGQDGWSTLFHGFPAEMVRDGAVIELRLCSLLPELGGRAVSIQNLELVDGAF